jgi:hypothetical protein
MPLSRLCDLESAAGRSALKYKARVEGNVFRSEVGRKLPTTVANVVQRSAKQTSKTKERATKTLHS